MMMQNAEAPGMLMLTIDVADAMACTLGISFDDLPDMLAFLDKTAEECAQDKAAFYDAAVVDTRYTFRGWRQAGHKPSREEAMPTVLLVLWTAFNSPRDGGKMRRYVTTLMRDPKAKAHITWSLSADGLAVALANEAVDLDGFVAACLPNQFIELTFEENLPDRKDN